MRCGSLDVMAKIAIDVILITLAGKGHMVDVSLAVIVMDAKAINGATVTFLRKYLLYYPR